MGGGVTPHTEEIHVENGFKDGKKKKRRFRRRLPNKNNSLSDNEKKLDSKGVKDATDKLDMWALLEKEEILYSEARVLDLGPRFMSIYIPKLAIERHIYYDEVEGLTVEWLDATSTLLLSHDPMHEKRPNKKTSHPVGKFRRPLEEIAVVVSPVDSKLETNLSGGEDSGACESSFGYGGGNNHLEPSFFPLIVHLLSTIPVALHAVGGGDGPLYIVARLYATSYFK